MTKVLFAVTYHNQKRSTVHKTMRSAPSAIAFCYDRPVPGWEHVSIRTGHETLGGKRNFAIDYAKANNFDLVSFLDDDDLFGPSWVEALQALEATRRRSVFHPQWNVLFGPDWHKIHEHIGTEDSRYDSKDALLNNPWSALCAIDPWLPIRYREHSKSDKRHSFEDWSFNLDTIAAGFEHVIVPNTFHFLRINEQSLGKTTHRCAPQHSEYFLNAEIRNKNKYSEDVLQATKYAIDISLMEKEFAAIHEIEPQLYFWNRTPKAVELGVDIEQEHYNRCEYVSEAVDALGDFRGMRDVFWTVDHLRTGGAEKALSFASRFLVRFPLSETPKQLWIDDVVAAKSGKVSHIEWSSALRNVLRAWNDAEPKARSLHICNTMMGWSAVTFNPELFDKIQVYLYVFNDDLRFASLDKPETKGFHSPLYRYAHLIDRPNFHIVTDSAHFTKRIKEKTGLFASKIEIPVVPQESKRKEQAGGALNILWAGRLDYAKGLEALCSWAKDPELSTRKFKIHVYGDGEQKWKDMIKDTPKMQYHGAYKSFEYIDGKYDFFWCTSEREGMPNTVKEAMASNLPVLTHHSAWAAELGLATYDPHDLPPIYAPPQANVVDFSFEASIPSAMNTYKDCLI